MRTWPLAGALLFLSTVDSASAGEKEPGTFGPIDTKKKKKSSATPDAVIIEELSAETFAEKVEQVANGSGKPAYTPVVMFHMPWCEHCKKTIPELQETAEKVAEAERQGQLRQYPATPKIFMLSCAEQGVDDICNKHTGKSYPSIVVFRDNRAIKFNRPRVASVITWWVFRTTRFAMPLVDRREHLDGAAQNEVAFVLHVESRSEEGMSQEDAALLRYWKQLALDYIEPYQFLFTLGSTSLGKSLGPAPSVHVFAPATMGLDPLPYEAPFDNESLKMWVAKNQFPPVVEVSPWTIQDLRKTGLRVVTLVHADDAAGRQVMTEFDQKVSELRRTSDYIFANINSTDEDSAYFLNNKLSLLNSGLPRIFIFSGVNGQLHFWEDPQFTSVEGLSIQAIESLLSNQEAFHDESYWSWMKTKRKMLGRYASRSWGALFLTVAVPLATAACIFYSCKSVWQALNEDEEQSLKDKHGHSD